MDMNILQVNKFHFPQGGADTYFLDICRALEERGHTVAKFCMEHERNIDTSWKTFFVSPVSYDQQQSFVDKCRAAGRMIYSLEARRKFARLLDVFSPDVIHVHNIYHQISPSILTVAKRKHIPIVMHLHDYKLLSPNRVMYCHRHVYERALAGKYWQCVPDKCVKDSTLKSALAAVEMYIHHSFLKVYENQIDMFIAPSVFMRDMVVRYKPEVRNKVYLLENYTDEHRFTPTAEPSKEYFLSYGRLVHEKGFDLVIRAFAQLPRGRKLFLAGSGEEELPLKNLAKELGIGDSVEFLGNLSGEKLVSTIQNALAVVVPSRWFEVFGLTNVEAMACGRPVIAARAGALPDVVKDTVTGLLFDMDNVDDLAEKMRRLLDDEGYADLLGRHGREEALSRFCLKSHVKALESLYNEAKTVYARK